MRIELPRRSVIRSTLHFDDDDICRDSNASFSSVTLSVVRMSLWFPRSSPSLITRFPSNYRQPLARHAARIVISSLHPTPHHLAHPHLLLIRPQSTLPTPDSTRNASTTSAQSNSPSSDPKPPSSPKDVSTVKAPLSTRVWKKVKHETLHYWHGSKLLVSEVRISSRLQWKILHGENLTRRERRQVCHCRLDLAHMC